MFTLDEGKVKFKVRQRLRSSCDAISDRCALCDARLIDFSDEAALVSGEYACGATAFAKRDHNGIPRGFFYKTICNLKKVP